jgi:hypothetical protein
MSCLPTSSRIQAAAAAEIFISRRRQKKFGLAEIKPKFPLSRPKII